MQELYVMLPMTDVWSAPDPEPERERLTQALLGDRVTVVSEKPAWVYGRVADGYLGWLARKSLTELAPAVGPHRVTVSAPLAELRRTSFASFAAEPLFPSRAFLGTRLPGLECVGQEVRVALPGGCSAYLPLDRVSLEPNGGTENQACAAASDLVLRYALALLGAPYLWGGLTVEGIDCSGLVYVAYRTAGLDLPRDADQQFACGLPLPEPLQPGDLVFFATEEPGFPSHVGFYLGQRRFLHASSRLGGVVITSLNAPYYRERFLGARRLVGQEGFAAEEGEVTRRIIV
ncbi:MAG TPA: C40 family peptidase [Firmicutes bacterium]|nr:C40 family peptidase [Bacillota bacterium]